MTDLVVSAGVVIPGDEIDVSFSRSGGPGGQNVNKVATKVEVRWRPAASRALGPEDRSWVLERLAGRLTSAGELVVVASRHRSQARNREDALGRLRETLLAALARPKRRRRSGAPATARRRRLDEKRRRSRTKRQRTWRGDE